MRRQVIFTVVTSICVPSLQGQSDVVSFHPVAAAQAIHPPSLDSLTTLCSPKLEFRGDRGWVTFVGVQRGDAILGVLGPKVERLSESISLDTVAGKFPPSARPGFNSTLDWAYLWDRNADGRVDYVAYLDGAVPVLPDSTPADYPTFVRGTSAPAGAAKLDYFGWPDRPPAENAEERSRSFLPVISGRSGSFAIHREAYPFYKQSVRLVFLHFVDDDFDGRTDVVVLPEADTERPLMVGRWTAFRSPDGDGRATSAWSFRRRITDTISVPQLSGQEYTWTWTGTMGAESVRKQLERGDYLFELLQLATKECGKRIRLRQK
jgi:hypothetical protein